MKSCCVVRGFFAGWACLALIGCAQTPYAGNSTAATTPQQQAQLAATNKQLEDRAKALDGDNKELDTLLAQSRQQTRLLQDQLVAVREQLGAVNTQLAQSRESQSTLERQVQTSVASRSSDPKKPNVFSNSSLTNKLPDFGAAGIEARTDGDTVRIELPCDRLFDPGGAQILLTSTDLINGVLMQIERQYPQQYIGIEGHTDNDPPVKAPQVKEDFSNNHQLSTARASAMCDYITARSRLRPNQLFIVGHGGNHPIVSNASTAGKARNRRIELVIYPERVGEK